MRFAGSLRLAVVLLMGTTVGLAGCGSAQETGVSGEVFEDDEQARRAFELIRDTRSDLLRAAFDELSSRTFAVESTISQRTPGSGDLIARRTSTARYEPGEETRQIVRRDSSGSFELGVATGLLGGRPESPTAGNPFVHLLPDQPTYASSTGPGLYRYEMLPDTSIGEHRAVGARAVLRPGAGDETVRSVRLFVEPDSSEILHVEIVRRQEALLFAEESTSVASLDRAADGTWIPGRLEAEVTVRVPFSEPRTLVTQRRYSTL